MEIIKNALKLENFAVKISIKKHIFVKSQLRKKRENYSAKEVNN